MPREFFRSDRVAAQVKRELAELLRTEFKDPTLGMVTLSDVEATRDMSLIKAYVSFFGTEETPQKCVKALNQQAQKIRYVLSGRIRLRVMPELRFIYDDSIERGMKMEALLGNIKRSQPIADGGEADEGEDANQ